MPDKSRIFQVFEGAAHIWREIYTDGRQHPKGDALPLTFMGNSVGHWEGDTLVVDVVGFHEGTWLDYFGHPHTDQLHVVEKYTRPNKETLHYEALIDDPVANQTVHRRVGISTGTTPTSDGAYLQRTTGSCPVEGRFRPAASAVPKK